MGNPGLLRARITSQEMKSLDADISWADIPWADQPETGTTEMHIVVSAGTKPEIRGLDFRKPDFQSPS